MVSKTFLKRALAGFAALLSVATVAVAVAVPAQAEGPNKLVTVLTSADPQVQLMAMVLTMQSIQQGAEASILLCGPGGDVALKDAPAAAAAPQKPKGMSPQGLMQKIMGTGAVIEVCAIYLPNLGADQSVLLEGIGVAKPPAMAGKLMASNTQVLSF